MSITIQENTICNNNSLTKTLLIITNIEFETTNELAITDENIRKDLFINNKISVNLHSPTIKQQEFINKFIQIFKSLFGNNILLVINSILN